MDPVPRVGAIVICRKKKQIVVYVCVCVCVCVWELVVDSGAVCGPCTSGVDGADTGAV